MRKRSPRSVCATTESRPALETPNVTKRLSRLEWSGSAAVIAKLSAKAVAASSNVTPSLPRFAAAFEGSHSHLTHGVYSRRPTFGTSGDRKPVQPAGGRPRDGWDELPPAYSRRHRASRPHVMWGVSDQWRPVQLPPFGRSTDMNTSTASDEQRGSRRQVRRRGKLSRTSSAETISPLSASAIERRSSVSSSGLRSNVPSASRVRTVTREPSSSVTPSTTTFPSTTFPVATFIPKMPLRVARAFPMKPND